MRRAMAVLASVLVASFAVGSLAEKKAPDAAPPTASGVLKWLTKRQRRVARRIRRRVGPEAWNRLLDFWRSVIRPRVQRGRGRRRRAFIRFARRFHRAVRERRVEAFLATARAAWETRAVVGK